MPGTHTSQPSDLPSDGRPLARVVGSLSRPVLVLTFKPWENPELAEQVKTLPDRRFDADTKEWHIHGLGTPRPDLWLRHHRARLHVSHPDSIVEHFADLPALARPWGRLSRSDPWTVVVGHRLAGSRAVAELLGPSAKPTSKGTFLVPLTDLVDQRGRPTIDELDLDLPDEAIERAQERLTAPTIIEGVREEDVAAAAKDFRTEAIEGVQIPDWFDLNLFDYQRSGALLGAAGRRLFADEMGLGKTRQALGAAACHDPERLLIICPPVALSVWGTEASAARVADPSRHAFVSTTPVGDASGVAVGAHVQVITPTRKVRPFPDVGVVIVSDSLLASRKTLAQDLIAWGPGAVILDESHREKTWTAARTEALRKLAEAVGGARFAISGTPMPNGDPMELAPQLAITGHLEPVFGGYYRMLRTYCWRSAYGWVPRKRALPMLHKNLAERVWVRRRKTEVLPDLPASLRSPMLVDVDLGAYREAHTKVIETIGEWIDEQTTIAMGANPALTEIEALPTSEEIESYAADSLRLISRLREGAGIAKAQVAAEYMREWIDANPADGEGLYERPLTVWAHHKVVIAALREAAGKQLGEGRVAVIDGSTSRKERDRVVADFQAGKIPVLIASITAAGVGITLTRCSDAIFEETDWTPALVQQAEGRHHRVGSTRTVLIRTMVAPGTLDETIQAIHKRKGELLELGMGESGHDISVVDADHQAPAREILAAIVEAEVSRRRRALTKTRLAAA